MTGSAASPAGVFAPSVRAGDYVFVSGQAAVDEDGRLVPGTFEEELRRSIDNVRRVLAQAGLTLSDVVKVGAYVEDPADLPEYNRIYPEYFPHTPARTTLTSCLGGIVKFELDVIAYAGD
ncbi:RidA family protein [Amycolatopsis thermoflava]|uniref:2-iminobutanoate/2-iminopropanoate deaminase n=1 Tax=Amycolatopsis thermoflava TaxID=84480 RepID=A0A3N2GWQ1_9PSEU|nr:RidA family protein [Amycolatopsis thermoflava]ROS40700.1 2-iminobutanoate/2-iminopropanoate deaminase [Amycolatopsis thermoflava]